MAQDQDNSGTPEARFDWLMKELETRFPHPRPYDSSQIAELFYMKEIDRVIADSKELNGIKTQFFNMIIGRTK